jgi:hypothetical protein
VRTSRQYAKDRAKLAFGGKNAPAPLNHATTSRGTLEDGDPVCPVCDLRVKTRGDGTLRSHRVGRNRTNSWPCPGSGMEVPQ